MDQNNSSIQTPH